ncbi:MAG TPA: hypothetical protein PLH94_11445 [Fimbriimonadaceae bacterium]|nr:hypothetical protein [Fimbriimonadaceae bacterium]
MASDALDLERFFEALRAPKRVDGVCPFCGWTEERWREEQLLGCPLCYSVFSDVIATKPEPQPS